MTRLVQSPDRPGRLALVSAATLLLLAACGGGSNPGDDSTEAAPPTSEGAPPAAEVTPPSTDFRMTALGVKDWARSSGATATPLTISARGTVAGGVGPMMTVRVDGIVIGTAEVKSSAYAPYTFTASALKVGSVVEVVYTNDATVNGVDRNLYVAYVSDGKQYVAPTSTNSVIDFGTGSDAFDAKNTSAGSGSLYANGALRLTWPTATTTSARDLLRQQDAVRFLQQASFGAKSADLATLGTTSLPYATWISQQMAMPATTSYVDYIQSKYALGDPYRPNGSKYNPLWVSQKFWERAANAPDQLRQRTAFALHKLLMVSQADADLWWEARAYANYMDMLNKRAFGNFRDLLGDLAHSPIMGMYLSFIRNQKEDATTGRSPDENFARELMQLFTIGLYELNSDGTVKTDGNGKPIETYTNADITNLAKVLTGWSWGLPDSQLTEYNFKYAWPNTTAAGDNFADLQPMKAYPGQHSTSQKVLFSGKSWARTLPANGDAEAELSTVLDLLFNHPNVGPFIGRQLIQHLVTSNPSPAYVGRVAAVFANNGKGVRGDLAAVVRAVLLDDEARNAPAAGFGKLREPILRVTQWMRACGAVSTTGEFAMSMELDSQSQRALAASTVFGYFRPGYVPPNTAFSAAGATVPEFQIVNEATVASWINLAEAMSGTGIGSQNGAKDVSCKYTDLTSVALQGDLNAIPDKLNLLYLGGRMSDTLRQQIINTMVTVEPKYDNAAANRAMAAMFLTLASPEYLFQR